MSIVEKKKKVVSYVESSADQSSAVVQDITQATDLYQPFNVGRDGIYLDQVRSPIGERSFPGQSLGEIEAADLTQQGFLWADTPEASVFIRKKQWREEGWNLGVPKGKSEDVDYKENRDFDLQVREIVGRIITRKLEWLNDHEQFTKSSAALRTFLLNNKEMPQFIRGKYEVTETNGEKLKSVIAKILELVYGQATAEKLPNDQKSAFVKKFFTDNENIIWNAVVDSKTANGQMLLVDEYNKQRNDFTLLIPKGTILFYDSIPSDTLSQFLINDTSGYISPNGDLTASAKELLLNLYAPTPLSDGAFTRYFQTLVKLNTPGADQPQLKTVFNGVMEFANISSISVSRVLNGDGTANLTFENPGNIMMFSRTDVELGLSEFTGEDPYAGMAGSGKGEGDKELPNVSNLVFYRGRYYTKTAKERLGYSYADITAGGPQVGVAPEFSKNFQGVKSVTPQKYTVGNDGETVESISKKTHYSIAEILELNPHLEARFNEQQAAKVQKKSLEEAQRIEAAAGLPPKDLVVATIGGVSIELTKDTMAKVLAADDAFFKATGKHIQVNSSYRDAASEHRFSDKYPMSGPSYHQRGMALDVQNWKEAGPYLRAQGFKNPLLGTAGNSKTWDPVHFSLGFRGWEQDIKTGKVGNVSGSEST